MKHRGKIIFFSGLLVSLAFGWLVFPNVLYKRIEQPAQFSHQLHVGENIGMTCEDCHTVDGQFNGIPTTILCADCHAETIGETENEKIIVEKYIQHDREIPWLVYSRQPENVYFSHAPHLTLAELQCEQCHADHGATETLRPFEKNRISSYSRDIWGSSISRLRNKPGEGMKMDDCTDCHAENKVQEYCLDCHK